MIKTSGAIWLVMSATLLYGQGGAAGGSGPYAAPSSAAYSLIVNAAHKIVADNQLAGKPVVIWDQPTFGLISSYEIAVENLKKTMKHMCPANGAVAFALSPSLDIGGAASGLAALVSAFTPSYSVQGQALTFDNSVLVAAFAREVGATVVYPQYLLPAAKAVDVTCSNVDIAQSLADLWYGAAAQADRLRMEIAAITGKTDADKARANALQNKLDAYAKVAEIYLAVDQGSSLLGKLLVLESLVRSVGQSGVQVIDLKLDAVGMESSTRTWIGWKKTSFACNVAAHYALMRLAKSGPSLDLKLQKTDLVNIYLKVPNEDRYGSSVKPRGEVNGTNSE